MKEISKHGFDLDMLEWESKLRGIYMSVSCYCEQLMIEIITKCEEPDKTKRDELKLNLPWEMGKTLGRCKKSLFDYNPVYHDFYLPQFTIVEELLKYRNMIAHGHTSFDPLKKNLEFIIFDWREPGATPGTKISKTQMVYVTPTIMKIQGYRLLVFELMKLLSVLERERG